MKLFFFLISLVYASDEALHHLNNALEQQTFEKYIVQTEYSIEGQGFPSGITRLEPNIRYQFYNPIKHLSGLVDAYFKTNIQGQTLKILITRTPTPFLVMNPFDMKELLDIKSKNPPYLEYFQSTLQRNFHAQENYDELLERLKIAPYDAPFKIPLQMHTIWLTNPDSPKLPKDECFSMLRQTMDVCAYGWQQIVWVHDLANCPSLVASPAGDPAYDAKVQIKEIAPLFEHPEGAYLKPFYEAALKERNYGKASDIARIVILWFFGGIYRDTDFSFAQDPKRLNQVCTFYCGFEDPSFIALNNAMIASSAKHTVLRHYMEFIAAPQETLPAEFANPVHETLFHTGPFTMTRAVCCNQQDPFVCALPAHIFYLPTSGKNKRFATTLGSHSRHREWVR